MDFDSTHLHETLPRLLKAYWPPVLVGLLLLHFLANKFRSGLVSIPGPSLAAYTNFWRFRDTWRGTAHKSYRELHDHYGPLVRIGPNIVSVSDPEAIPIIYNIKTDFHKTASAEVQKFIYKKKRVANLFSHIDPAVHRSKKRLFGNAYSLSSILEAEPGLISVTTLFMKSLRERSSKPIDLGEWLEYYTYDSIGEIALARRLGFLRNGGDIDGMIPLGAILSNYASVVSQKPILDWFGLANPLFPYLLPSIETKNGVLNLTIKTMEELGFSGPPENLKSCTGGDFLSHMARARAADPERYSSDDILIQTSATVFAATDTTAITLRAIIYYLLRNPLVLSRFTAELDAAEPLLSPVITYRESIDTLPYLQAVVKEAMRLHPAIGLPLERYVPAGGATIAGKFLPAGTTVGMSAWVVHRNPDIFTEPDAFVPERWIGSPPDQLKRMEKSMFQFGAGARSCVGKYVAQIQTSTLIPQLFREFDVQLEDEDKEWEVTARWFVQQVGLVVNLVPRRST